MQFHRLIVPLPIQNYAMIKTYASRFFLLTSFFLLFSCASRKDIAYYQNIDDVLKTSDSSRYETVLKPDDLLMILVLAENPESAAPYNLPSITVKSDTELESQPIQMNGYLIDSQGNIEFPGLGTVQLGGLTRQEATAKMINSLKKYIKDPKINLRILNYKVTVSGEVTQPKTHIINGERIALIDAIAMSGDLTAYGRRDNIMIIREKDGKKEIGRVDITKADFVNSPYYYLTQNDHVYVEPNRTKVNASAVGPNTAVIFSALSLLLTVVVLIIQ